MQTDPLVAVVDDDPSIRRTVARTLSAHGYRVETFSSAEQYLAARPQVDPSCLLADIRMPGLSGLELQRSAREAGVDVPTVFMTATGDVNTVVEAMKEGAADLLSKPFSTNELLSAIGAATDRGKQDAVEHRSLALLWKHAETLTPREAEIAALVSSGRLNKQVAALVGITEKTVKVHRARAMKKLEAASLAEMVRIVDRIVSAASLESLHVDGVHVPRPPTVEIMRRILATTSGTAATKAPPG